MALAICHVMVAYGSFEDDKTGSTDFASMVLERRCTNRHQGNCSAGSIADRFLPLVRDRAMSLPLQLLLGGLLHGWVGFPWAATAQPAGDNHYGHEYE
jgi:hypothetical protein